MNPPFWISVGTSLACTAIIAGCCMDVERLIRHNRKQDAEIAWLRDELSKAKRSMHAIAARLPAPADSIGPIAVTRPKPRPTTIPGIPSARPEVPRTGSTASGKHRKAS